MNYVDFVIDRAEFMRLTQHIPTVWIYAYIRHSLADLSNRGAVFFLQMTLLVLQLHRDPQLAGTFNQGSAFLVKMLIDETLESTVPLNWLRKRKRESGVADDAVEEKRARDDQVSTTKNTTSTTNNTKNTTDSVSRYSFQW